MVWSVIIAIASFLLPRSTRNERQLCTQTSPGYSNKILILILKVSTKVMRSISICRQTDRGQKVIVLKFSIIGEAWLDNSFFQIINPQVERFEDKRDRALVFQENPYYIVFHKIRINRQNYLIVKPKSSLDNRDLNLQETLSERELQIVDFVACGKSNKQIAKKLKISEWTVSTHLRRIFIKLKVNSRAAMVYYCASLIRYRLKQLPKQNQCWQQKADNHTK